MTREGAVMAKFRLGNMVMTAGCLRAYHRNHGDLIVPFMLRHVQGDWGTSIRKTGR